MSIYLPNNKKVTLYFIYFPRASWSIVEKMKKTKGYEPPDIHYLQKDFESCVLSGDIECQYIEGTDVEDYPGTMSFDKFLLAVESRDLSQADKSITYKSVSFPKLSDG